MPFVGIGTWLIRGLTAAGVFQVADWADYWDSPEEEKKATVASKVGTVAIVIMALTIVVLLVILRLRKK